jgi:quinoprotein glucose dehydrogenase
MLYVKTTNAPAVIRIVPADHSDKNPRASEVDADYIGDGGGATTFSPNGAPAESGGRGGGLPLVKPPYGELVAIDLNKGDIAWRVPFGDTPAIRANPALKGVGLPERLGAAGASGVIVTKGGLVLGAGGDSALYAFDKATGKELSHVPLDRRGMSTPMTYRAKSGRQFVVIAAGQGPNAALMAFTVEGPLTSSRQHGAK